MKEKAITEQQITERLKAEVRPLVQKALDGTIQLDKIDYAIFRLRGHGKGGMLSVILGLLSDDGLPPSHNIATSLFNYLGFVETVGNTTVDIIIMLVIANGIDFHIESQHETPRIRHVNHIFDLDDVPLRTKLNFLRENGIKTIPSIIDCNLRNDIAHLNFTFDPDTKEITLRGRPLKSVVEEGFKRFMPIFSVYDELDRLKAIWNEPSPTTPKSAHA
jgi:hypothetical protein